MTSAAILFAGRDDFCDEQHAVYANDLALWCSLLTKRFGIERRRVNVLFGDGGRVETTEPSGFIDARAGTASELDRAVGACADVNEEDAFFFVASNHGTDAGLLLADRTVLGPTDAVKMFARVRSKRQSFVLGQCKSGLFASLAKEGRAVLAGCGANQSTRGRKDDAHGRTMQWTQFLYDVAAALGGDELEPASATTLDSAFREAERRGMWKRPGPDGTLPELFDPSGVASMVRVVA